MKKLSIVLNEDSASEKSSSVRYMPGDTIAGHLTFNTSSSVKYTCIKIHFVGVVSTKLSKATEEVYVLNQQVVLLGKPTNAEEYTLEEGKHSWPFEFLVPMQHIPSSGKYRHGNVKYNLMATVSSSTFLGGMQNIKANRAVEIKDLVNCAVVPYSNPISMTGSKNIKDTNKTKNLAIATVKLGQSAYLHSQQIQVTIELSHPKSIQRDPGCWIQLLRRECYFAGEHSKEYEHVIATTAEALHIGSDNTGAIHTTLNIPADAYPSMTTTKIVSIQYRLLILFDMRPKMGFLEMKNRRTVNRKLRTRLLEAPGGFEVDVPIVIGTISDKEHQHRPSLVMFDARDALGVHDPMTSVADATSQLSLCTAAHGATRSTPSSPGPSTAPYGQGSPTPSFYVPATHYSPKNGSSGYNTMPATPSISYDHSLAVFRINRCSTRAFSFCASLLYAHDNCITTVRLIRTTTTSPRGYEIWIYGHKSNRVSAREDTFHYPFTRPDPSTAHGHSGALTYRTSCC
ncbi:Arrestin domain-containing protein 3 [Mortierella sp. GBA43]|nr:Arrestin domain-containing protein 3 [Mortierella sp. GBA43]